MVHIHKDIILRAAGTQTVQIQLSGSIIRIHVVVTQNAKTISTECKSVNLSLSSHIRDHHSSSQQIIKLQETEI